MEHMQFKANQTAAAYVARELSDEAQEAFELHMMSCSDCLDDVEAWRVVREQMPAAVAARAATPFRRSRWMGWGLAASIAGAMLVSGMAGWYARTLQQPGLDSSQTVVFNMPAVTRGFDGCTAVPLAADARAVLVRVSGVASGRTLIATDASGTELAPGRYAARQQADHSWVIRFDARSLRRDPAQLEARGPDGSHDVLGCVSAGPVAPER
jgi:Putative zinc-finger